MKEIEAILRAARDQKQLEYDFDLRTVARQIFGIRFAITDKTIEEYACERPEIKRSFEDFRAWVFRKKINQSW